jgi:cytochrome P450
MDIKFTIASAIIPSVILIAILVIGGFYFKKNISSIPTVPFNTPFGYLKLLGSNPKIHDIYLLNANRYGAVYQYHCFGQHFVVINDKRITRQAYLDLTQKGNFHQTFAKKSIFSLDTNEEWRMRRNLFRGAFSTLSLKHHQLGIDGLAQKLCSKLQHYCDSDRPIELDVLFSQYALDALCSVAFGYSMYSLDNSRKCQLFICLVI